MFYLNKHDNILGEPFYVDIDNVIVRVFLIKAKHYITKIELDSRNGKESDMQS